jgi:L-amino acid N-acyltransferase YncA
MTAPFLSSAAGPTISDIVIRFSNEEDVEAITAIYGLHVSQGTSSFEIEPPTIDEMKRRRHSLLEQGYPYFVADRAGRVVGYTYVSAYRPRAAYQNTVENSVYLHPDVYRRGIGSALLHALIEACEAQGFRQMVAVVGDSANVSSIRLHERLNFRLVGTLRSVGNKHGRWLDTVLLQRALGTGDETPIENQNGQI